MGKILLLIPLGGAGLIGCFQETVDWTGEWSGTARWVVDGEQKEIPLRLGLAHEGAVLRGTIHWGDYEREITAASANGPEVELESATAGDRFRLKGLFRNEAIEGRFWILYVGDPEPYPGSFKVARNP